MHVVIVGGSISGLLHGVLLKQRGHHVTMLERLPRSLNSHGTGVTTSAYIATFLAQHDRLFATSPMFLPSVGYKIIAADSSITSQTEVTEPPAHMHSWDSMYYRLRANFDGLASKHNPVPPADFDGDGNVEYRTGIEVTEISNIGAHERRSEKDSDASDGTEDEEGPVVIRYVETATGRKGVISADLVIGADGSSSTVRRLLAPDAPQRKYSGYVAWRGVVPESAVSESARELLSDWFTFHTSSLAPLSPSRRTSPASPPPSWWTTSYVVVYHVPGPDGSLVPGHRGLNFVWYEWLDADSLSTALTDSTGHTHRWSVGPGLLQPELWAAVRDRGCAAFSRELGEMLRATERPFVQAISDYDAPPTGAALLDGRALLVGDAQCLIRPHIGMALNQAAMHALELGQRLLEIESALGETCRSGGEKGDEEGRSSGREVEKERVPAQADERRRKAAMSDWSRATGEFGQEVKLRSVAVGMYYMTRRLAWLPAMVRWRMTKVVQAIRRGIRFIFRLGLSS